MSEVSKGQIQTAALDHLGLVAAICQDLKIAQRIDDRLSCDSQRKVSPGRAVVAMILNGLGFTNRRLYLTDQFFESKAIERLLGSDLNAKDITDYTPSHARQIYDENPWKVAMIKIRKAETSDIPQLETLFLITRQDTFHWENPDKFKLEDFKSSTSGETIFVAEDEGATIVGFVSVWEQDAIPFIHHLFVAQNHQRKGIGELLMQNLLAWLPPPYRLKCVSKNRVALAFYHKHGWIDIERGIGEDGEYLLLELPSGRSN